MVRSLGLLMEMLAVVYGISTFFGEKIRLDVGTVSFIGSEIFLITFINEYDCPAYLSLSYVLVFVYGLIEYKDTIKRTLLNCLLTISFFAVLQQVFSLIFFKILETEYAALGVVFVHTSCIVALFLIKQRRNLKSLSDFLLKNEKIYYIILTFILICIGGNIIRAKINGSFDEENYVQVIYFSALFACIVIEWQKARRIFERELARRELNQLYNSAYEELIELVRDRQHDMKNHINAIYSMIYTTDTYEELVERQKKYCKIMLDSSIESNILISVNNPILAGYLYKTIQDASDMGIDVVCKFNKMNEELSIPEYEIIDMLGVLLDNAIEAVLKVDGITKKIIIEYSYDSEWEIFSVANRSREYLEQEINQFFIRGFSSKGKNRGIGLDKVRRKLKSIGGGINVSNIIDQEENFLKFAIMLPKNND